MEKKEILRTLVKCYGFVSIQEWNEDNTDKQDKLNEFSEELLDTIEEVSNSQEIDIMFEDESIDDNSINETKDEKNEYTHSLNWELEKGQ